MAQRFSKSFYNSKEWKKIREYILKRDKYLCVMCGNPAEEIHHVIWLNSKNIKEPTISMAEDNLISLCRNCHFGVHAEAKALAVSRNNTRNNTDVKNGFEFDDEGNVVRTQKIYLITGSPGSGKTTYALKQIKDKDIIVDLDLILTAITGIQHKDKPKELTGIALDIRDLLYSIIKQYKGDWLNAYVIATLPKHIERIRVAKELNADIILIDTDKAECIRRVLNDDDRIDKEKQMMIVKKYWSNYTAI